MIENLQHVEKIAAFTGAAVAMGLGAIGSAIGEGHTAAKANEAIARNPESMGTIYKTMLVGQSVAESASIFALVIAMLLLFSKPVGESGVTIYAFLAAGFCVGFGTIGSGIGTGFASGAACTGIARQPKASGQITTTMLIGSAVCQTPAIFSLVTSLILLLVDFSARPFSPTWAAILGAGIATGFGAIGSSIGEGLIAGSACDGVARNPSTGGPLTNLMLLGQAVTETTAIYGLLISFILLFKSFPPATSLAPSVALLGAGLCMGIGAFGPGIGEGVTGQAAIKWIARNGEARIEITRSMLVGQAVAESTGIYSLVIALILIFVV